MLFLAKLGLKLIMGNSAIPYIALNVIRALNILSIISCIIASASLLVKTATLSDSIGWYNYFDLGEKCLIIIFAMWLLATELPLRFLDSYKARKWPLLYDLSGFIPLAICLLFLGFDVLSFLAKAETNAETLGNDFYRMVQAAGFMSLVMSVINFIATFAFQSRKHGMSARMVRAYKQRPAEYVEYAA